MRPTARIAGLTSRIAARLRAARKRAGLTQYRLAGSLGLSHRQNVTRIEDGQRSLTAEQLILAMDLLGVDLDYFTDPFRLEGEGEFTFRTGPDVASAAVDEFERRAGRWIALYRELSRELGREPRWLELKLSLTRHSSFSDARDAGAAFSERMELGDCPAAALRSALEDRLGILVLEVDAPPGIASAAVRAKGIKCVLVNRHEPEGQRNYGMAHGLFRLLTWDAIPPDRVESVRVPRRGKRWLVARLAESFATALLMPWPVLRRQLGFDRGTGGIVSPGEPMRMTAEDMIAADRGEREWSRVRRSPDLPARLIEGADELRVSVETYVRRLRRLYLLSREEVDALDGQRPGRESPCAGQGSGDSCVQRAIRPVCRRCPRRGESHREASRLRARSLASGTGIAAHALRSRG
ncbi:MAG: XRE family transcriptional regulator [Gammaproteobacteria bacterium]|nr:XRE family transcriptional regulator [Gammaproteobacteria bacterium]MDE0649533.1 XRE family transcriptional regulator [Gammaproteobacteria bacterium]